MSITEQLSQCIEALLAHGFEAPLYFTCIANNGAMVYGRYSFVEGEDGMQCDLLASHETESDFTTPINMMFVDPQGKAARVVFGESGPSEEIQVFLN